MIMKQYIVLRACLFMMAAITLMFFDYQGNPYVLRAEAYVAEAILPAQRVMYATESAWYKLTTVLQSRATLAAENAALQMQLTMLSAQNQRLNALESENKQFALLFNLSQTLDAQFTPAILLSTRTAWGDQVILNKGGIDKVYSGQAVINGAGLLGQVISVFPSTSRVLLITDAHSAVPVQMVRTGMRALAMGDGHHALSLANITRTTDIHVGDKLMTSGLGGRFPAGFPVGVVSAIRKVSGQPFLDITVVPIALPASSKNVLLVSAEATHAG